MMHKPDDNEPINFIWLIAVGGREGDDGGVFLDDRLRGNRVYVSPCGSELRINGSHVLSHPTRRQVRLLCEALGIALMEGKE